MFGFSALYTIPLPATVYVVEGGTVRPLLCKKVKNIVINMWDFNFFVISYYNKRGIHV